MDEDEARRRFVEARVARLATRTPRGRVELVPVTFAMLGLRLVTAVDHKPKWTTELSRLTNIAADPEVTLLADHYDEDWSSLWWVRLHGVAEVVREGPTLDEAVDALVARYPQYRTLRPTGPAIVVTPERWLGWSSD